MLFLFTNYWVDWWFDLVAFVVFSCWMEKRCERWYLVERGCFRLTVHLWTLTRAKIRLWFDWKKCELTRWFKYVANENCVPLHISVHIWIQEGNFREKPLHEAKPYTRWKLTKVKRDLQWKLANKCQPWLTSNKEAFKTQTRNISAIFMVSVNVASEYFISVHPSNVFILIEFYFGVPGIFVQYWPSWVQAVESR